MSARARDTEEPIASQPEPLRAGRVLVADDEPALRELIASALRDRFDVTVAPDGQAAFDLVLTERFDVVLCDIRMPRMDGLELLAAIKHDEPDLPVILLTGAPELATAIKAVELGAFRYLTKPFAVAELVATVARAHQLSLLARTRALAASLVEHEQGDDERRAMGTRLDRALRSVMMAFQPLVDVEQRAVIGYEALLRSGRSSMGAPIELLVAAERLDRLPELGRCVRRAVVTSLARTEGNGLMFINLHPLELLDDELIDPSAPLAAHASRVVLEVTERAALDRVDHLADRVQQLRKLGYRLAVDDLGAGYASLNSFAQLQPDFVKLDMALVQNAPGDAMRRRLIRSMIQVCEELGIDVVGEGVETEEQRDTLARLGCRVMQGYLFARPALSFPTVRW